MDDSIKKANATRGKIKAHAQPSARLFAFQLRRNLLRFLKTKFASNTLFDRQLSVQSKKDASSACFDKQDLHLQYFRELIADRSMPNRKIWNIRLPKARAFASKSSGPITRHTIVNVNEAKNLDWESTKQGQPERQFNMTSLTK